MTKRRVRVLPYKQGSRGAKALAIALGGKVLKLEGSKFVTRDGDLVINWGNSADATRATTNNDGGKLVQATNKLFFFQQLEDKDYIPQFWEHADDIPEDAFPVVCRTVLQGHSGAGIVVAGDRSALVPCSLYTQYVKKKDEYRVHVGRNGVIGVQQKKRRLNHPDPNWQVRNHANGFIYARSDVDPPQQVLDVAKDTLKTLDLDFGAVDVIWNEHEQKAYVLELNCAPGLEGTTVEDYVKYFTSLGI